MMMNQVMMINNLVDSQLIVCFKSRALVQKDLEPYRNLDHEFFFDIEKKQKLYIFEYLISTRRRLFFKAKLFCKVNNYKYLWTRNRTIFMRKQNGDKKICVNNSTDFTSLEEEVNGAA